MRLIDADILIKDLGDLGKNRRYCAHLGFRVKGEGFCADGRRKTAPEPDDC